jgi:hypothetical protein
VAGFFIAGQLMAMTVQTVKLGGTSFVIVPEKDFRKLEQRAEQIAEQEKGDVAESRRRMKERGGKKLSEVRRQLGLMKTHTLNLN